MNAFWITTALLMVSATLHAQDQTPIIVNKKYEIERDSSEYNRMDKKFEALVILTGSGPNAVSTTGFSLGYHYTPNQIFLLEGTGGRLGNGFSFFSDGKSNTDLTTQSFGIHFKHLTSNSFYYRFGLDYRSLNYKYTYGPNANSQTEEIGFKAESVAASFYIGNQWQWENFTLGCDWIGVSAPIFSDVRNEYKNSEAQLRKGYYEEKIENYADSFVRKINVSVLRFYLGASF